MRQQPKHINNICQNHSALSKITQRTKLLDRLNHAFQQSLPAQFSAHCRLANINGKSLIIHTDNASYSSLIRFQAPALCRSLSRELDLEITTIEVKVRPHYTPFTAPPSKPISLPESAASALQQTADNMDDGPLKKALERLAKRQS
tara:strand:- start:258 stop:695 length:438 start_codon:yes stop_codon:yes gene_type:complete